MAQNLFDLQKVHDCFNVCLKEHNEDITMDSYLDGFKELNKFFQLMGTVFGFVSSDVKSKIEILEELRTKENSDKYLSFNKMLDYERSSGLLNKPDYMSGSRTLLRLHRGLDFIRKFLFSLGEISSNDKTSHVCQTAYNQSLAQFHPWLIRKGALMAMYTMPTREQLLKKVCLDAEMAVIILPDMLQVTKTVYERTQQMYTDYDLHGLP